MNRLSARHADPAAPEHITPGVEPSSARAPRISQPSIAAKSPAEAEQRYIAARDAWTAAMRAASSGRPADMAGLAIAQEAFEAASAERELWRSGEMVAIQVDPGARSKHVAAALGNEMAWRNVRREEPPKRGGLGGLVRRLTGR